MYVKNYYLHWIADRANILSKYVISYFFNLGRGFCGSFFVLLPKVPASRGKKIELIFAALYFYSYELKNSVSDFKNLNPNRT